MNKTQEEIMAAAEEMLNAKYAAQAQSLAMTEMAYDDFRNILSAALSALDDTSPNLSKELRRQAKEAIDVIAELSRKGLLDKPKAR